MKNLKIQLKPYLTEDYTFQYAEVTMVLEDPRLESGDMLASMWVMVAGVPGSMLDGLTASDDAGEFILAESIEKDPTGFDKRFWRVNRASSGDTVLHYRFYPRDVTGIDRCYPLFDAIQEENGVLICGVTTLVAVPEGRYQICFSWDRSAMPPDACVASIRGEGNFTFTGTPSDYSFSLYMVGKIRSAASGNGKYNVYWLDSKLPDQEKVEAQLPGLLDAMCQFFQAPDTRYSVFFRKEPFSTSNSGTAFSGGFAMGYSDAMPLVMDKALNTIAHEIVHNWPALDGLTGEIEWFSEGTAEYYSMAVPFRAGIVGLDRVAQWLTDKSLNYYNNPHRAMPNSKAAGIFWKDRDAQRLPYGRGLFYLLELDRKIRERSGGAKTVDELVLHTVAKRRAGEKFTNADWENLLEQELGREAVEDFRQVMSGKLIEPSASWLNGAFAFTHGHWGDVKNGFFDDALIWSVKEGCAGVRF